MTFDSRHRWMLFTFSLCFALPGLRMPRARAEEQRRAPMRKIFISADLEGVTGVIQPSQLGPDGFEYARAREWMTGEVKAAISGARFAGATEFVVCDSHGNAQNLLIDQFSEDVRIVRGFPRPLEMMQGIDESFDAVLLIGYHASEWSVDAVRGHTISSVRLLGIRLNGSEVMEAVFNAGIAGHFGVPVVFMSGDRVAIEQAQKTLPWIEGVVVKEPYGYHSAMTVTPAKGQQMIRDGVARALKRTDAQVFHVQTPVELQVGFKATIDAERAAYIPGLTRIDTHTVRGTFADMLQVTRLLQILTSLQPGL
jgi:D-amino peptidase